MCGGWVGDQIDDAVDFFVEDLPTPVNKAAEAVGVDEWIKDSVDYVQDDVWDDVNDLVSGVGEIMDDQLGFDPNGGGLVPYYDAIGVATTGIPIGSIGAQAANTYQTLESGDFGGDYWRSTAGNVARGGLSYGIGQATGAANSIDLSSLGTDAFTAGINPNAAGGFGGGYTGAGGGSFADMLARTQLSLNAPVEAGLGDIASSFLGSVATNALGSVAGNAAANALGGSLGTGGYNPNAPSPNFGTSALMSGRNVGNAAAALYQADQARGAGNDYLNYLYDAMALQKEAQGQAADLIGGAYDDVMAFPPQLRDYARKQFQGHDINVLGNIEDIYDLQTTGAKRIYDRNRGYVDDEYVRQRDLAEDVARRQQDLFRESTQDALGRFAPYATGGAEAQNVLTELLTGTPSDRLSRLVKSPGYDFRLSEGLQALDRSAAARGGLLSGATLKQAQRYGQDMASQEFDKYVNQLAGLSTQGYKASGQQAELDSKLGLNLANVMGTEKGDISRAYGDYFGGLRDLVGDYETNRMTAGVGREQALTDASKNRMDARVSSLADQYGDQTSLGLGRATNLANILTGGAATQTELMGQLAKNKYNIDRDTTPEIQAGAAVGDIFSQPAVQQGVTNLAGDLIGGIGDAIGGLFGDGGGASGSFGSYDFGSSSQPTFGSTTSDGGFNFGGVSSGGYGGGSYDFTPTTDTGGGWLGDLGNFDFSGFGSIF